MLGAVEGLTAGGWGTTCWRLFEVTIDGVESDINMELGLGLDSWLLLLLISWRCMCFVKEPGYTKVAPHILHVSRWLVWAEGDFPPLEVATELAGVAMSSWITMENWQDKTNQEKNESFWRHYNVVSRMGEMDIYPFWIESRGEPRECHLTQDTCSDCH